MNEPFGIALIVGALGLALWSAVIAIRARGLGRAVFLGALMLELGLLVQLVVAAVATFGGVEPPEPGLTIGYLSASVLILPIVVTYGMGSGESERWDGVVLGVASLAIAAIVWRLLVTWPSDA